MSDIILGFVVGVAAALIIAGVCVDRGWFDRTTERIARFMFPGMYRTTDAMREMSDELEANLPGNGYARKGVEEVDGTITFKDTDQSWTDFGTVTHRIFDPPLYLLLYPERSRHQEEWDEPFRFELFPTNGFKIGHIPVQTRAFEVNIRVGRWEVVTEGGIILTRRTEQIDIFPDWVCNIDLEFSCELVSAVDVEAEPKKMEEEDE
jgi:hypothetical protein